MSQSSDKIRLVTSLKVHEGDTLRLGVLLGNEMRAVTLKREITSSIVMDLIEDGQIFHLAQVNPPYLSTIKIGTHKEEFIDPVSSPLREIVYLHVEDRAGSQDQNYIVINCHAHPHVGGVWVLPGERGLYLLSEDYPAKPFTTDLNTLSIKASLWTPPQGRTFEEMVEAAQLQEVASRKKANRETWIPPARKP